MKKKKAFIMTGILFIMSCIVGALLMELLLRLFYPYPNLTLKGLYMEDPEIGLRLRPNFTARMKTSEFNVKVQTNSEGYRDYERAIAPDAYRIMALGDSFTFGCWVDFQDAYLTVLENLLNADSTRKYQVIKMGGPAAGPKQQYNLLQAEIARVQPNLVLLGFFVGNDFRDAMFELVPYDVIDGAVTWKPHILDTWLHYDAVRGEFLRNPQQDLVAISQRRTPIRSYLRVHSHLYQYLGKMKYLLQSTFSSSPTPQSSDAAGTSAMILHPFWYEAFYLTHYPKPLEEGVQQALTMLENMKNLCDAMNTDFLLVLIPVASQVEQPHWENFWKQIQQGYPDFSESDIDRTKPQKILTEWAQAHQVKVLDLLSPFQDAARHKKLYYTIDIHWNKEGHRLAGHQVYDYLKTHQIGAGKDKEDSNP